jgi:hypothetical protein
MIENTPKGRSDNSDQIIADLVAENMLLREELLRLGSSLPIPVTVEATRGRVWTTKLPDGTRGSI